MNDFDIAVIGAGHAGCEAALACARMGMRTLAEDGWRLVRQGVTTVEEVLSVTTAKEVARTTRNESIDGTATAETLAGLAVSRP